MGAFGNESSFISTGNAVVSFQGFNFLEVNMFSSSEQIPMDESHINLSFKVCHNLIQAPGSQRAAMESVSACTNTSLADCLGNWLLHA